MEILSKKSKREVFARVFKLIQTEGTREWVQKVLGTFPEHFWTQPASTTGKYHPACANVQSGLLIHTKRVIWFAVRFIKAFGYDITNRPSDMYVSDNIIAACILHDGWKGGKGYGERAVSFQMYQDHPILVEENYRKAYPEEKLKALQKEIFNLIKYHMGPWTPDSVKKPMEKYLNSELIVYLSDYLASRKEIRTKVDSFGGLELIYEEKG